MTQDHDARIAGRGTTAGTERYRRRHAGRCAEDHFRKSGDLWLSSIGIGTYLGEPDEKDDHAYRDAIVLALRSGCNVVDTAVNYRFQRSERAVGAALRQVLESGDVARDEVVVATKGGFIPFDGGYPADPAGWFRSALLEPGIAAPDEVVANCHIMTPRYLEAQIAWSRRNMGLEAIDIYYVHNPETQLAEIPRSEFLVRIRGAFELLERAAAEGTIGIYGVATWDGLRVAPDDPGYLSLKELLAAAEQAGGPDHHFRAIQLPVNLFMTEACLEQNQKSGDRRASLLEAAADAGMTVMSSGSLLQGQVIRAMGGGFNEGMPYLATNAQRGLHLVRSAPGLATALVGMKSASHVQENLATAAHPRMPGQEVLSLMRAIRRSGAS